MSGNYLPTRRRYLVAAQRRSALSSDNRGLAGSTLKAGFTPTDDERYVVDRSSQAAKGRLAAAGGLLAAP